MAARPRAVRSPACERAPVASPLHWGAVMMSAPAQLARDLTSRRWFAPLLWFTIAFVTAALTWS